MGGGVEPPVYVTLIVKHKEGKDIEVRNGPAHPVVLLDVKRAQHAMIINTRLVPILWLKAHVSQVTPSLQGVCELISEQTGPWEYGEDLGLLL